jgi:O-acetyl-ADP-ribose deacetylase (regulator of RNase III)
MQISINIRQGDITQADVEIIVNAANNHLWMGSGVAGAIKRRGGEEIEKEAVSKGPVEIGQAVETTAGKLPYKYIIHAAGMGQDLKTDEKIVKTVTMNTLLLADRLAVVSIAFPAIGTGVGGLLLESCAGAMLGAIRETSAGLKNLKRIDFVLFDKEGFDIFKNVLDKQN